MGRRKPAIEVEGAKELRAALKKAGDDASDLKDAHQEVGEIVVEASRPLTPFLSGRLAGTTKSARQKGGVVVRSGSGLPYGAVIHWGWPAHNIEPTPYLYDALDERRTEVIEAYETAINKIAAQI